MKDWKLPWEGGCRCGQVRLKVNAPPILTMACHCTGCQKLSASAFSLTVLIPAAGLSLTGREPVIGGLHGAHKQLFCPHCLTWLYTCAEGAPLVGLRATMLDDTRWFSPFIEVMISEKLPWMTASAPNLFDTAPSVDDFENLTKLFAAHHGVR